jgi:hypothetical protein
MMQTFIHRGVGFAVWPGDEEGCWRFQFTIAEKTTRGARQAKLIGLAVRRIQLQIDRELRQRGKALKRP